MYTNIHIHTHTHIHMCAKTQVEDLSQYMYTYIHIHTHTHIHMCAKTQVEDLSQYMYTYIQIHSHTHIHMRAKTQVEDLSLFNGDDCELYAKVWEEFDTSGGNAPGISIENLRPFIERLASNGHRAGFSTTAEPQRFRSVWCRVMTNPKYFPPRGLPVCCVGMYVCVKIRVMSNPKYFPPRGLPVRCVCMCGYVCMC